MDSARTLVLIDHDPSVLKLLGRVFRSRGYTVLEANSADEAARLFEKHLELIDLVVADVELSHADGDLLTRLRSFHPDVRVVYLAASNTLAPVDLPLRHALVAKPFALDALVNAVRETLDAAVAS